jgi:hypothetical protein
MAAIRIRAVSLGLCVLGAFATADCGAGASSWVVHRDGRIGPLRIDVSTDSDVRHFAGKPFKVEKVFSVTRKAPVGDELYYHCGRGCVTTYAIAYSTGRLSDFVTQSVRFVSERGSRVGMPARLAAAAEHRPIRGACGEGHGIYLREDERHLFVLGVFAGKVSLITYLGPHTLSYEGLC